MASTIIKGTIRDWLDDKARRVASAANFPREYRVWHSMIRRVTDPRHSHWQWYHARGIGVCRKWWAFESFLNDLGPMPEGTILGRFDKKRGFEPGNCGWMTRCASLRRRGDAVIVSVDGHDVPLRECAETLGIPYLTLYYRWIRGWSVDRLFLAPGTAGKQPMNRRRGAQRRVAAKKKRRRAPRLP